MQITLQEEDIKQAIKNYVAEEGVVRPVADISFAITRSGGQSVSADIVLEKGIKAEVSEVPGKAIEEEKVPVTAAEVEQTVTKPVAETKDSSDNEEKNVFASVGKSEEPTEQDSLGEDTAVSVEITDKPKSLFGNETAH